MPSWSSKGFSNFFLQSLSLAIGTYIAVPLPDTVILLGCSAIYWHSQYFGLLSIGIYRICRVNFTKKHEKCLRNRPQRLVVSRCGCAIDAGAPLVASREVGILRTCQWAGNPGFRGWGSWESCPAPAIPTTAAIRARVNPLRPGPA